MALVRGTNSGFVTVSPTADPAGTNTTIDGSSVVTKDTSPALATKIVEMGWYRGAGTNPSNFEVALYSESGGVASARLFIDNTNSSNVQGWITVAVDWAINGSTAYWLAVQMDAHSGTSSIDTAASGGAGSDVLTAQTTLNDPYGGGAVADADGMYAIYAKVNVNVVLTPGFGEIIFSGFAPTITASDHKIVLPGVGDVAYSGFASTAIIGVNIDVDAGVITYSGFEPIVLIHVNVSADVGVITMTGHSPVVTIGINVNADVGTITLTGHAPTIDAPRNILADAGTIILSGFSPTVETPKNVNTDVGVITLSGFFPTILTPVNLALDTGILTLTGYSPDVSVSSGGGVNVNPNTGEITIFAHAPIIETTYNLLCDSITIFGVTKRFPRPHVIGDSNKVSANSESVLISLYNANDVSESIVISQPHAPETIYDPG